MFPHAIKRRLESNNWYLRFRYSSSVLKLWLMMRPAVRKQLEQQRKLYLDVLRKMNSSSKIIFDIGANEGFLTDIFIRAGYKVIAVEPDETNFRILSQRFLNNPAVTCVLAAVSDSNGTVKFNSSTKGNAFGTLSDKWKGIRTMEVEGAYEAVAKSIKSVTLDCLIKEYGQPCFVKIDVEGYEEVVLRGLSNRVHLLSFEAILPHFVKETRNSIKQLAGLSVGAQFNYAMNDELGDREFQSEEDFLRTVDAIPNGTIEIFCSLPV